MEKSILSTRELAERWGISPRTLERWRWSGKGPYFVKIGGHVAYRFSDIEQYESERLRRSTSDGGVQ